MAVRANALLTTARCLQQNPHHPAPAQCTRSLLGTQPGVTSVHALCMLTTKEVRRARYSTYTCRRLTPQTTCPQTQIRYVVLQIPHTGVSRGTSDVFCRSPPLDKRKNCPQNGNRAPFQRVELREAGCTLPSRCSTTPSSAKTSRRECRRRTCPWSLQFTTT